MEREDARKLLEPLEQKFPFPEKELERLQHRRWILRLAGTPRETVGLEIGVFRGHFSAVICQVLKPRKLYMIDPWTLQGELFGWGKIRYTNDDCLPTAQAKQEARLRVAQFPATEAVMLEAYFPDGRDLIETPLDWAYVDADHHFEPTLGYLRALAPLIKEGGVILGDDWNPDPDHPHHGVFRAVHAFMRKTDWNILAAGRGTQWAIKRCPA